MLGSHSLAPKPATEGYCCEHSCELGHDEGCHPARCYPAKVSESDRAMVTAGLAKEVEAVNQ
jgi:hypothetical protein